MISTGRVWIVAASIGAVEVLKDQGLSCGWNYVLRSLQQQAKNNFRALSQANRMSSSSSSSVAVTKKRIKDDRKQSEESLRKVMYLSCWGPN